MGDGADFAGPVWLDGDVVVDEVEDGDAAEDDAVADDDEGGEPEGDAPAVGAPIDGGEGDDGGEEEAFVSDGVDDCAEFRALVPAACDPAIDAVAGGGGDEDSECPPAEGFDGCAVGDTTSIVDGQHGEHRDQHQPGEGDLAGEGHV